MSVLLQTGQRYMAEVVQLADFGAFVKLPNGFQALLHISELSHARVRMSMHPAILLAEQAHIPY